MVLPMLGVCNRLDFSYAESKIRLNLQPMAGYE